MRLTVSSIAMLLAISSASLAAPVAPAAPKAGPATVAPAARPAPAAPSAKPAPAVVVPETGPFAGLKTELKRLMIGNQAGIVKVLGPNREGVAYSRGIDDQSFARINHEACDHIFSALGLKSQDVTPLVEHILLHYATLPRKESVAIMSVAACSPTLDPASRDKAEKFLVEVMDTDKDVHARRQAILALAVQPKVSAETAERVVALYERSENLWETFPVQQFCQYHAAQLRHLDSFPQLRQRVAAVNSLYTPAILNYLDHPSH